MFDQNAVDVTALAQATPGPALAAQLAAIDLTAVNGHARVVVMAAWERQVSWSAARMYEAMTFVARSPECTPDSPPEVNQSFGEFASAEVGAALGMSPGSADLELSFAYELSERLPQTRAALLAGRISLGKAQAIAGETSCLRPELAAEAEEFILAADAAKEIGLTRAQLVRRLRRKVLELDPAGAEQRRREAHQGRRLRFGSGVDGTGSIYGLDLPLTGTAAAQAFVKAAAKRLERAGDGRTMAQIEADVFLDLLRGRPTSPASSGATDTDADTAAPSGSDGVDDGLDARPVVDPDAPSAEGADAERAGAEDGVVEGGDERLVAKVELVADLETWLGLAARAGQLRGLGAISPEVIAEIQNAAAGGFEYCRTVTVGGKVVHHQGSSRRYKPTAAQRRLIQAMRRTCSQPGCSRPAAQCDLDHTVEHRRGGPSCACNLAPLCRRHHRAKHEGRWFWTQNQPGHLTTQSPLGHRYTVEFEPPLTA
jgi:hypothetical protein